MIFDIRYAIVNFFIDSEGFFYVKRLRSGRKLSSKPVWKFGNKISHEIPWHSYKNP